MYKYRLDVKLANKDHSILEYEEEICREIRKCFDNYKSSRNKKTLLDLDVDQIEKSIKVDFESRKQLDRPYQVLGTVSQNLLSKDSCYKKLLYNNNLLKYDYSSLSNTLLDKEELNSSIISDTMLIKGVTELVTSGNNAIILEKLKTLIINDEHVVNYFIKGGGHLAVRRSIKDIENLFKDIDWGSLYKIKHYNIANTLTDHEIKIWNERLKQNTDFNISKDSKRKFINSSVIIGMINAALTVESLPLLNK